MTLSDLETWQSVLHLVRQSDLDGQLQEALASLQPEFLSPQLLGIRTGLALPDPSRAALAQLLSEAATRAWGRRIAVEFADQPGAAGNREPAAESPAAASSNELSTQPAQLNLPFSRRAETDPDEQLRLNPNYTFENFVAAPNNRLAHAACVAVCESPGMAYNPLFVHGTVGLGKSHLLQATCHRLLHRYSNVSILYLSCESFVNQFIASVERGELEKFRYRYRHLDVLVIDDIHFLADKERTQEEFFHTFNTLYQLQKQVILSSDSPPQEIPHLEERLVSRFKWGLEARLDKPSFETRAAIVTKKARIRGLELPEEVVQFVSRTIDSNIRELEGAVIRLAAQSKLTGVPMTLDLAKEVLAESHSHRTQEITVSRIIEAVVKRFDIRISDLQGKKRNKSVALPRQISMYLSRRLTKLSLEEIGGYFGGRDHTTVLHAERKIEHDLATDSSLKSTLEALTQRLVNEPASQD